MRDSILVMLTSYFQLKKMKEGVDVVTWCEINIMTERAIQNTRKWIEKRISYPHRSKSKTMNLQVSQNVMQRADAIGKFHQYWRAWWSILGNIQTVAVVATVILLVRWHNDIFQVGIAAVGSSGGMIALVAVKVPKALINPWVLQMQNRFMVPPLRWWFTIDGPVGRIQTGGSEQHHGHVAPAITTMIGRFRRRRRRRWRWS